MTQHNRKMALERLLVGVPLTIIGSVVMLVVGVIAIVAASIDWLVALLFNRRLLVGEPFYKRFYHWLEHNAHNTLYAEHGSWQWVP